jgi:putative DNA primase/helicase
MLTNNKPQFKLSESMIDRLRFINFKSRFDKKDYDNKVLNSYLPDIDLLKDLKTDLKYYVLKWLIVGANNFYIDGHLNIPDDEELQKDNLSYIDSMDSINCFINDCCINNPTYKISCSNFKKAYMEYCRESNIPILLPTEIKQKMSTLYTSKISHKTDYYIGLQIKEDDNDDDDDDKKYDLDM